MNSSELLLYKNPENREVFDCMLMIASEEFEGLDVKKTAGRIVSHILEVSEKMGFLSKNHQLICITHLPQIAAMADVHFMIEKKVIENETQTSIRQLDEKESIDELARILGGAKITQMVLDSAKEMRQLAKNARGHGFQNEPE